MPFVSSRSTLMRYSDSFFAKATTRLKPTTSLQPSLRACWVGWGLGDRSNPCTPVCGSCSAALCPPSVTRAARSSSTATVCQAAPSPLPSPSPSPSPQPWHAPHPWASPGAHFRYILNFLRDGTVHLPPNDLQLRQELLREASLPAACCPGPSPSPGLSTRPRPRPSPSPSPSRGPGPSPRPRPRPTSCLLTLALALALPLAGPLTLTLT